LKFTHAVQAGVAGLDKGATLAQEPEQAEKPGVPEKLLFQ